MCLPIQNLSADIRSSRRRRTCLSITRQQDLPLVLVGLTSDSWSMPLQLVLSQPNQLINTNYGFQQSVLISSMDKTLMMTLLRHRASCSSCFSSFGASFWTSYKNLFLRPSQPILFYTSPLGGPPQAEGETLFSTALPDNRVPVSGLKMGYCSCSEKGKTPAPQARDEVAVHRVGLPPSPTSTSSFESPS